MDKKEILAHISNYTKGRKEPIQYIVVHYTANNGDKAEGNGNYFAQPNRNASAHYFVDENTVVQSIKDNDTAWHCGAKSYKHPKCRNNNSIGVEMCSEKDSNSQYYINEQTKDTAIAVVKMLMKKYSIPLENVLRHYDVTGKICPEPFVKNEIQWLDFKKRLSEEKKEGTEMLYNTIESVPKWAKPTIQKMVQLGALQGNEKGELMLTNTMLRIFVVIDRMINHPIKTIKDVPDWAKPTVQKLINKGALKGDGKGNLMLTETMLRLFMIHDNMGLYGE